LVSLRPKRFVDEGAFVFITGRRQKELDEAVKAKGKTDILVANADVGEFAPPPGLSSGAANARSPAVS